MPRQGLQDQVDCSEVAQEDGLSGVRLLVGTKKGAFVLTSDERREKWEVTDRISGL